MLHLLAGAKIVKLVNYSCHPLEEDGIDQTVRTYRLVSVFAKGM